MEIRCGFLWQTCLSKKILTKILCGGFNVTDIKKIDVLWDDNPVDISAEANFIWSIANKLRGTYMPDKYGVVLEYK